MAFNIFCIAGKRISPENQTSYLAASREVYGKLTPLVEDCLRAFDKYEDENNAKRREWQTKL